MRLAPEGERKDARIYVHVAGAVRRPGSDDDVRGFARGGRARSAPAALGRAPTSRRSTSPRGSRTGSRSWCRELAPAAPAPRPAAAAAAPAHRPAPSRAVHLSTATVEQLDGVDGIGPTLAQRIIEYRDTHGGFRSLAELAQVDGIGEKRLATLREALQL